MRVLAAPAFRSRELNPYARLLYKHMAAEVRDFSYSRSIFDRCEIFHLHWPEWELNIFKNAAQAATLLRWKLLIIDSLRLRGAKIVWTAHNLKAHGSLHPRLEQWFWSAFTSRVDGYIALSEAGSVAARERFPSLERVPGYVIPHGHYRDEYPSDSASNAREELGISPDAKMLLSFGQVREYKNIPALIRAFRKIHDTNVVLCIAGRPLSEPLANEIRREAAADFRVRLDLYNVPKERVQLFFRAADLVVLPYRDILNSGTALLALSFNRPVLVPDRGAMGELRLSAGPQWVRTYTGEIDGPELDRALAWAIDSPRPREADLDDLEWPKLAEQTLRAYAEIISARS